MKNKKTLIVSLSLLPLMLVGCSNSIDSDTPSFNNDGGVSLSSPNSESSKNGDTKNLSSDASNGNLNTAKPGIKEAVEQEKIARETEIKERGLKRDSNGNPYSNKVQTSDDAISKVVTPDDEKPDNEKPDNKKPKEGEVSRYTPTQEAQKSAYSVSNAMLSAAKNKDWNKACSYVFTSSDALSFSECLTKMKRSYSDGISYTSYTDSNSKSLYYDKDTIMVSLKDKPYEENQQSTLTKQDGTWKVVFG